MPDDNKIATVNILVVVLGSKKLEIRCSGQNYSCSDVSKAFSNTHKSLSSIVFMAIASFFGFFSYIVHLSFNVSSVRIFEKLAFC